MKYTPYYTNKIKKQLKLLKKRGYNMSLFKEVVDMLLDGISLPHFFHFSLSFFLLFSYTSMRNSKIN
ncbi:MAG: type II toxin-antitoxin system YafQ family toxin [Treponema sp.]|jgi:mRNA-degrading endonuclease YafQ of YafQ-DinJ toxin-antitoxin module|nr:type II toxin-antitoxin system YafQ family toxin [Treponema sp.]